MQENKDILEKKINGIIRFLNKTDIIRMYHDPDDRGDFLIVKDYGDWYIDDDGGLVLNGLKDLSPIKIGTTSEGEAINLIEALYLADDEIHIIIAPYKLIAQALNHLDADRRALLSRFLQRLLYIQAHTEVFTEVDPLADEIRDFAQIEKEMAEAGF